LLRELEAAPPDNTTPGRTELTDRELEVLRLVAEGLTDGRIAKRLYVSPRTASNHLRSIYNKLGVPSRAAAVRQAVERGLI
jgi:DNA-binding CsgD family transcriptional regulator